MAKKSVPQRTNKSAQKVVKALASRVQNLRDERIQELTGLIAARMPPRKVRDESKLTLADRPFEHYAHAWSEFPIAAGYRSSLALIEETCGAALGLFELIEREASHRDDAEANDLEYRALEQRHSAALMAATRLLLGNAAVEFEQLREHCKVAQP